MGEHDCLLLPKIHLAPQTFAIDTSSHLSPIFTLHPHDFLRRRPQYNCKIRSYSLTMQAFLQGEGQGEAVGQLIRGGLYEVDALRRRMRCVYWPEHAHRISRGTWFVEKAPDWVPLKVHFKNLKARADAPPALVQGACYKCSIGTTRVLSLQAPAPCLYVNSSTCLRDNIPKPQLSNLLPLLCTESVTSFWD